MNAIRNAECPEDMAGAPAPAPVSAAAAAEQFAQAEAAEQANPPATVGSVASEIIFEADIHAIAEGTAAPAAPLAPAPAPPVPASMSAAVVA